MTPRFEMPTLESTLEMEDASDPVASGEDACFVGETEMVCG